MKSLLKLASAPAVLGFALTALPAYAQDAADEEVDADTIVVTGSRLASPNLDSASPVTVVSAEDIKSTGTTRVEDLVNSLPQVFAGQGSNYSNGASGAATLNLRGLGSERNLVLVNGRRLVPGDPSTSAADINMIPGAMVKRIDVLTGGASSVYGADAVSGVVNFVMDTKFEGFRIDGQYSFYNHNNDIGTQVTDALSARGFAIPRGMVTDGGTVDATVAFGTAFDGGRGHITAYAGYRKVNAVLQRDRDYSACSLTPRTTAQVAANGALYTCGGSLTSANGTIFDGSSSTYQIGAGRTLPAGFTRYNFAPLNYFQRPDERYTAGVFADYEISDSLKPYMEFMFMDDRTLAQIAPSGDFGNTTWINCDNPLLGYNGTNGSGDVLCRPDNLLSDASDPFATVGNSGGAPVVFTDALGNSYTRGFAQILRRNVEGGGRVSDLQHISYRGVVGMKGDLGDAWQYDAFYQYGRTNYNQVYKNDFSVTRITRALDVVTNPVGGAPVCRSVLDGTDPNCVPWDIWGTGTVTQAALNYVQVPGIAKGINTEQIVSGYLTGDLGKYGIKSPAAKDGFGLVVGAEYRKETLDFVTDVSFQTGDLAGQGAPTPSVAGQFDVKEVFAELRAPLVQESFVYDLTVTGGFRHSSYSVNGGASFSTDTYKVEGEFAPIRDIRFRGGYNRAVRAPTLQDFFAPQIVGLDGSDDPCAGFVIGSGGSGRPGDPGCIAQGLSVGQTVVANPANQYNGLGGGNPNLKPEIADTWTAGVVLQPGFLPGFSMSVDWFNIKVNNAIQGIGADTIITQCTNTSDPFFCGLIRRDSTGSLWRSSNGYIINLPQNIGYASTKGVDVSAAYSRQLGGLGRMNVTFVGTWLDELVTFDGITVPVDCVGYHGGLCGSPNPKWRHQMRVGLDTKMGVGVSVRWRYFDGVAQDRSSTNPNLAGTTQPANLRIPSVSYFDLALTADVGDHFKFRLGANNLLDKTPPLTSGAACPAGPCNGNSWAQVYDSLGRYVYAGVTLDF
ncbi:MULTISPECIES: TonB-dependent receptor [unclassified Novosphingobium]|uniref:TonB-dependent receptor domain-containing protein n=1 Tax=unclassified Novosphingobium TaxID=2644732 RepID=UPI000ED59C78|nr:MULTISPECIES: TonB-dependent receptor [unclassified Novosphingobium]HCF25230.1 TonB-dependent receptor [Novosphingobium sp.]HQV02357.1 TonB-dependent receptor [Novosphingobium sp.]